MALLNEEVAARTREVLGGLVEPVRIRFFAEPECHLCGHVAELLAELGALSPQLRIETRDFRADRELAAALGVRRVPAMLLGRAAEERAPVRFYGLPSGLEFGAFLRTLVALSTGLRTAGVDAAAVAGIARERTVKVFVLAGCPRCPEAVSLCASVAAESPKVTVEVIEAAAFPDLVTRYRVGVTPKIVIDDAVEIVERITPADLLAKLAG